jgi:hypothetical protein
MLIIIKNDMIMHTVINAIMIKKLLPRNVILPDGEEFGGIGSQRVSEQINKGKFEVLNGY